MSVETTILQFFASARFGLLDQVVVSLTALGSTIFALLLAFVFYRDNRQIGLEMLYGIIPMYALVYGLKALVARPRPDIASTSLVTNSFPSGHTATAFFLAFFLSDRFGENKIVFATLAVLVALSRLYLGVHFPTDVVAGAVIGAGFGYFAVNRSKLTSRLLK